MAVLNSGRSCHTPCAGVIAPPLFFMSVYAKVSGLGIVKNWRAMYSDVIPVDDIMLQYQRYLTTTKSVFLCEHIGDMLNMEMVHN